MSVALVFPGQGALSVRMDGAPARHVPAARATSVVGDVRPPSSHRYDDPRTEPTLDTNTRPASLAADVVCLRALCAGRATEASDV